MSHSLQWLITQNIERKNINHRKQQRDKMLIWFESCDGSLKFPVKLNKTYQISRPAKAPIAVGSDVIVVKLRDDKASFSNLWVIDITHISWVLRLYGIFVSIYLKNLKSQFLENMQNSNWKQTKTAQFLNWMTNQNILPKSGKTRSDHPIRLHRWWQVDVGDKNGENRHQHLKLVASTFRLQHPSQTSM